MKPNGEQLIIHSFSYLREYAYVYDFLVMNDIICFHNHSLSLIITQGKNTGPKKTYTKSFLDNADLFYANITNMTFQTILIPYLKHVLFYFILYELIPLNLLNTKFN